MYVRARYLAISIIFVQYSWISFDLSSGYHRDAFACANRTWKIWCLTLLSYSYNKNKTVKRKLKLLIRIRSTPDQTFPTKRGTNLRQDWKMKLTINYFAFLSHKKHWYMSADNMYILFLKREKSPAFSFICIHFFQPRKKEEAIMHGAKKQKHKNVKAQETKNVCNFY